MLQQTRVGAVLDRYAEFLRRFPNLRTLAAARLNEVLAAWSGLGYYRRARALHEAARIVVREHAGRLPANAESLRALPGIGRYTAAAIASIAFGESCAVVDGNVERAVRRLFGWRSQGLPQIWSAAQQLFDPRAPGDFNQAMMELGAIICLPAQPRCHACPVRRWCATGRLVQGMPHPCPASVWRDRVGKYSPSKPKPARKAAGITYALVLRNRRVYLVRRGARESLMPGMWELPVVTLNGVAPEFTLRHSITVTDYTVHVCRVDRNPVRGGRWWTPEQASGLPLTGLARRILRRASVI
jgi:A/G-specific adenine glycosylase